MTSPILPLLDLERAGIILAMEHFGPRRKEEAARALGISRKCLYDKLAKHGLSEYVQPRTMRPKA